MENEFRFSFMQPRPIDTTKKNERVFFKSSGYLFHGVKFHFSDDGDSEYMRRSTRFEGTFPVDTTFGIYMTNGSGFGR